MPSPQKFWINWSKTKPRQENNLVGELLLWPFPSSASWFFVMSVSYLLIQTLWVPDCSTGHQRNDKLASPELCGIARIRYTHQPTAAASPSQLWQLRGWSSSPFNRSRPMCSMGRAQLPIHSMPETMTQESQWPQKYLCSLFRIAGVLRANKATSLAWHDQRVSVHHRL